MNRISRFGATLGGSAGFPALALLALVVAFLGGSSRPDAVQLIALRPLVALFLIPALYLMTRERLASLKGPAVLLGLLAAWMALQLLPLPPSIWQALPGREPVSELDAVLGLDGVWRPISMVPSRGWNALASLVIPAAGLLLAIALGAPARLLLVLVLGLGLLDAALGLLQVMGAGVDKLYFYDITNKGSAVGIFANQNHSGVFSALTLLVAAHLATDREFGLTRSWQRAALAGAFLFILLAALVGGSRAGLLTTILALAASGMMFWNHLSTREAGKRRRTASARRWQIRPAWLLLIAAAAVASMIAAFVMLDRWPAFESIASRGEFEDLRWEILPTLREMAATYWLFGSGFGSFEEVYHIFEPDHLLFRQYINQAHNDWAQLVIEGGLPAALLALATLAGMARGLAAMVRTPGIALSRCIFWLAGAAILLSASLVDYPLRAPTMQLVLAWLVIAFCRQTCPADSSGHP